MLKTERPMTVREAAEYLQYHPEYVRDLARRGELKGSRTGRSGRGTWRFTKEDLDAFSSPRVEHRGENGDS